MPICLKLTAVLSAILCQISGLSDSGIDLPPGANEENAGVAEYVENEEIREAVLSLGIVICRVILLVSRSR